MAKRKRAKRAQGTLAIQPREAADLPTEIAPLDTPMAGRTDTPSSVGEIVRKFADWAVSKALDYLLVGVVAVMTAPTIAIWIYFRSGRAAWTYPWLYAALGFIAACLVIISVSAILAFVRAQRQKAVERASNLRFVSKDKGYLDHLVNQAKGFKKMNSILNALAKEMLRIANTNNKATARVKLAQKLLGQNAFYLGHKIASTTAKKLNKHAVVMQTHLGTLETVSDGVIESFTGYLTWYTLQTPEQAQALLGNKSL